ncbi:glycosyltransferase family 2 protein [Gluconobacter morbifer]|uniref:Glycosyltransferase 2-like domain-containing protein n=1 Tax=Gluconobacter morbifer G707 TaxID=1088869 RepID=G6XI73_9PROT|nr:glycosyltransferase family 2 protein [Gluconobacter morbifer]EHH68513.1 hypothetical protein GMO_12830 [Gluconobacter morbifer G707]
MKKPLAVVTMVYNEPALLPAWCRHYGAQVGAESCYVIDHGSSDGTTRNCGAVNVRRIPRSPQDDERRTRSVGHFCESLLEWYESVIYVDVDEFLLADPALFPSLTEFACATQAPVITATGFDVVHVLEQEEAFDYSRLISFSEPICAFPAPCVNPC